MCVYVCVCVCVGGGGGGDKLSQTNEPQRQKTYLLTCPPSKDSDQTAHSRSLIRIFSWAHF